MDNEIKDSTKLAVERINQIMAFKENADFEKATNETQRRHIQILTEINNQLIKAQSNPITSSALSSSEEFSRPNIQLGAKKVRDTREHAELLKIQRSKQMIISYQNQLMNVKDSTSLMEAQARSINQVKNIPESEFSAAEAKSQKFISKLFNDSMKDLERVSYHMGLQDKKFRQLVGLSLDQHSVQSMVDMRTLTGGEIKEPLKDYDQRIAAEEKQERDLNKQIYIKDEIKSKVDIKKNTGIPKFEVGSGYKPHLSKMYKTIQQGLDSIKEAHERFPKYMSPSTYQMQEEHVFKRSVQRDIDDLAKVGNLSSEQPMHIGVDIRELANEIEMGVPDQEIKNMNNTKKPIRLPNNKDNVDNLIEKKRDLLDPAGLSQQIGTADQTEDLKASERRLGRLKKKEKAEVQHLQNVPEIKEIASPKTDYLVPTTNRWAKIESPIHDGKYVARSNIMDSYSRGAKPLKTYVQTKQRDKIKGLLNRINIFNDNNYDYRPFEYTSVFNKRPLFNQIIKQSQGENLPKAKPKLAKGLLGGLLMAIGVYQLGESISSGNPTTINGLEKPAGTGGETYDKYASRMNESYSYAKDRDLSSSLEIANNLNSRRAAHIQMNNASYSFQNWKGEHYMNEHMDNFSDKMRNRTNYFYQGNR